VAASDDLKRRLEALNRGPIRLRTEGSPKPTKVRAVEKPQRLEEAVPGEIVREGGGQFYLVERTVESLWPDSVAFHGQYDRDLRGLQGEADTQDRHEELASLVRSHPDRVAYLDIETCGFTGTPVFLVGLLVVEPGGFVMRQYLARDYSEEAAMLRGVWADLAGRDTMVSFNGKSFDLPFLRDRMARYRIPICSEPVHADLLHHCRRRWKDDLPNCRLQTLETFICSRYRSGDIPGGEIPDAYHHFVKTGHLPRLKTIIHHNALDLVTMTQLVVELLKPAKGEGDEESTTKGTKDTKKKGKRS